MRWIKRALGLLVAFAAVLSLLGAALVVWLFSESGQQALRHQAESLLNQNLTGATLSLGDVDLEQSGLVVGPIQLVDQQGRDKVSIEQLRAEIDLWRSLQVRGLVLDDLQVHDPVVRAVIDEEGELDLLSMFPSSSEEDNGGAGPTVLLQSVSIAGGQLWLGLPERIVTLDRVSLQGMLRSGGDGIQVVLDGLTGQVSEPALGAFQGSGEMFLGEETHIRELEFILAGTSISADFQLESGAVNGHLEGVVSPELVEALAGRAVLQRAIPFEGRVASHGKRNRFTLGVLDDQWMLSGEALRDGAWQAQLHTRDFDPQPLLVDPLPGEVRLSMGLQGQGQGTTGVVEGDFSGTSFDELALSEADVTVSFGDRILVESLSLVAPMGAIKGSGGFDPATGTADFTLQGAIDVGEAGLVDAAGAVQAHLNGTVDQEGRITATGEVGADELTLSQVRLQGLSSDVALTLDQGHLNARGLASVAQVEQGENKVGSTALNWSLHQTPSQAFTLEASGRGGGVVVAGATAQNFTLSGWFDGGPADNRGEIALVLGETEREGQLLADSVEVGAAFEGESVALAVQGWQGDVSVAEMHGTYDLGAQVAAVDHLVVEVPGLPALEVDPTQIQLNEQGLAVDATLHLAGGELELAGVVEKPGDALAVKATEIDLSALVGVGLPEGTTGLVSAQGTLTSFAGGWRPALDFDVDGFYIPEVLAPVSVTGSMTLTDELDVTLRVNHNQAPLLWSTFNVDMAQGELGCGGAIEGQLILEPNDPKLLAEILHQEPPSTGAVSAALMVSGEMCDPGLSLAGVWIGQVDDTPVRVDLKAVREGPAIVLSGTGWDGTSRRVALDGVVTHRLGELLPALLAGKEVDWTVENVLPTIDVNVVPLDLPTSTVSKVIEGAPTLSGSLQGGLKVLGPPNDPRVVGGLQWIHGTLGSVEVQSGVFWVVPEGDGYRLQADLRFTEGELSVKGTVSGITSQEPPTIDLAIESTSVPLAILDGAELALSHTRGDLSGSLSATGPLAAPVFEGGLRLTGGAFWVPDLGIAFHDVASELLFTGRRYTLRSLQAQTRPLGPGLASSGSLRASGGGVMDGWVPKDVSMDLVLDNFLVMTTNEASIALNGGLVLNGTLPVLDLRGDLSAAEVWLDLGPSFFAPEAGLALDERIAVHRGQPKPEVSIEDNRDDIAANLNVDLDLDFVRNVRVAAEVPLPVLEGTELERFSTVKLETLLGGELKVNRSNRTLSIEGELETITGELDVLNSTFSLSEGSINFLGEDVSNPFFGLEGVKDTGQYGLVSVQVVGPLEELDINPSAEDYPDPSDVVSLLLFGTPASAIGDETGQANSAVMAAAMSSVSSGLESAVGTSVVDTIDIGPNLDAIRVGWALNEKLFVSIELQTASSSNMALEDENLRELRLEYLFHRQWYAELMTGDRGASAADLVWRLRF